MLKKFFKFIEDLVEHWSTDNISTFSAALAYYTLFALAPFIIICTALAGLVFGADAAQGQILTDVTQLIGQEATHQIQTMIASAKTPVNGLLTELISFVIFLFGASGVFSQIQLGLNHIWGVKADEKTGVIKLIKNKFLSFTLVLSLAFLSLVSLVINVLLSLMSHYVNSVVPEGIFLAWALNFLLSLGIITLLFAMIFKILPDVELTWSEVRLSAFITALLFTFGKFLLGQYLQTRHLDNAFGPAGSLIIILIWVYYSAQILFIGAELCKMHRSKQRKKMA